MNYLSVCSGIEAATVAWHPLGWQAVAYSEIEKFPSEVLAHHYPTTPNLGDMTKFKEWTNVSNVDVLVGGTPCQSFSVAGLRKGLDDPRGNLMLTYLAIARQYSPRWLVWENVPGVLSSNGGLDFASLLRGMGELGYGFAYRVLDAQYFGVAQRRRRVFVVGYLGNWRPAAAVLFERHSLQGHPAPSRQKRQVAPTLTKAGTGVSRTGHNEDGWYVETPIKQWPTEITSALDTNFGTKMGLKNQPVNAGCPMFVPAEGFYGTGFAQYQKADVGGTIKASGGVLGGGSETFLAQAIPIDTMNHIGRGDKHSMGDFVPGAPSYTLTKGHSHAVAQPIPFDTTQITSPQNGNNPKSGDPCHPLAAGTHPPAIVAPTLTAANDPSRSPQSSEVTQQVYSVYQSSMAVRRLTPVECERLQGFPDSYTDIKSKGKPTPDGPRYKALGNSMAVPVMAWIGQRIQEVEQLSERDD
jgi:DNA (cytosine-5)-methyltransferase 1